MDTHTHKREREIEIKLDVLLNKPTVHFKEGEQLKSSNIRKKSLKQRKLQWVYIDYTHSLDSSFLPLLDN